jgi:hypothetical protein
LSALLNLSFAKGTFQDKGKTYIERATIAPVFRAPSGSPESGAIQIRKLYDCSTGAEGQEARKHLSEIGGFAELVFGKGDSEA